MDALDTFEHAGLEVEIHIHDAPDNPRDEWDHTATLIQCSNDYFAGDDSDEADELRHAVRYYGDRLTPWYSARTGYRVTGDDLVARYARIYLGALAIERWDDPRSEAHGWIMVTEDALLTGGWPQEGEVVRETAQTVLRGELDEYRAWCDGEVYGYVITDPDTGEEVTSCWGYYGDDAVTQAAKEAADDYAPSIARAKIDSATADHMAACLRAARVAKIIDEARLRPNVIDTAHEVLAELNLSIPPRPDVDEAADEDARLIRKYDGP